MLLTLALAFALSAPDPKVTPGALCAPTSIGYEGSQNGVAHCRRRVTTAMKKRVLKSYGIPWQQRGLYEIDHFVPLCLGGSNDLANLWPEPWKHAKAKDALENRLCRALRAGLIKQAEAVRQLAAGP